MKRIFPNFRIIAFELIFGIVALIAYYMISAPEAPDDRSAGIALMIFAVVCMMGLLCLFPHFFVFDKKGVRIYYIFGLKEEAEWGSVTDVTVELYSGRRGLLFSLDCYEIFPMEGKRAFFMDSKVNKTWYIRRAIEKYWDGTIDDDGFFARRRRAKAARRDPSAAEAAERKMKSSVHEVLKRYAEEFGIYGVSLKVAFSYGGETKRPNNNYTYEVTVAICGKSADERLEIDLPLIKVIRGKSEYRPKEIKGALREVDEVLTEELSVLKREGYAEYFKNV